MTQRDETNITMLEQYALGFAGFLCDLIPRGRYRIIEAPRTGADCSAARFTVENAIGQRFKVDIEPLGVDPRPRGVMRDAA